MGQTASSDTTSADERDRNVLNLMLFDPSDYPMSIEEIGRTLGGTTSASESVSRLADAGLVHRMGDFVWPTLAARKGGSLEIGVI